LWIGERDEVVRGDPAVAREPGDRVDLVARDRVVEERWIERRGATEL